MSIKEQIYQIIDSFLVEAKDQNGNERSIERLNQDRHLAVKRILEVIIQEMEKEKYPKYPSFPPMQSFMAEKMYNYNRALSDIQAKLQSIIKSLG